VVRGNELYVATVGPAEAYLVRQARLLTLPDASPDSGMPAEDIDGPEVWHGEITAGDCLILMSPNVTGASASAHPGRRAAAASPGRGRADPPPVRVGQPGQHRRRRHPVHRGHRGGVHAQGRSAQAGLAGRLDGRRPGPLADPARGHRGGGVTAVQTTARHAQIAADGWLRRGVYSLFDRMPQRPMSRGRVTPMTVRRERQQRAAFAIIGLLAVIAIVGTSMWFLSGANRTTTSTASRASRPTPRPKTDIARLRQRHRPHDERSEDGLPAISRTRTSSSVAEKNGYPTASLADAPRGQVVAGSTSTTTSPSSSRRSYPVVRHRRPGGVVLGPDGAAYVLDNTVNKVYRVNLRPAPRSRSSAANQLAPAAGGGPASANPRLLATGGGDVLVLDSFNSLWRWHPAAGNTTGRGS
jgi:hypothetical protein